MPYRILALQSARNDTARRREIHTANSPLLREHAFEHDTPKPFFEYSQEMRELLEKVF